MGQKEAFVTLDSLGGKSPGSTDIWKNISVHTHTQKKNHNKKKAHTKFERHVLPDDILM